MARIKLIVTGDMEKSALHNSLKGFFPDLRNEEDVSWDVPRKVQCATSYPLRPLVEGLSPSTTMVSLAKAMFAEVFPGKHGSPADFVIVIDDVELGNLGQEALIAEHFRAAVNEVFRQRNHDFRTESRLRDELRQKCSFHVLKPMVEAYLFGDPNALQLAGIPNTVISRLVHPTDVEQFESNDPNWLPFCQAENLQKQLQNKPWWRNELHPKRYIEYLTDNTYEETENGKEALFGLDWRTVPKNHLDIPIVRSLFEDISDWFGIVSPINGNTDPNFWPLRSINRADLLLRNM